jgi:hypothetical protein
MDVAAGAATEVVTGEFSGAAWLAAAVAEVTGAGVDAGEGAGVDDGGCARLCTHPAKSAKPRSSAEIIPITANFFI